MLFTFFSGWEISGRIAIAGRIKPSRRSLSPAIFVLVFEYFFLVFVFELISLLKTRFILFFEILKIDQKHVFFLFFLINIHFICKKEKLT